MKTYIVSVTRKDLFEFEVEAQSPEEAAQIAEDNLADIDDPIGTIYHQSCEGFVTQSVNEI